MATIANSLFNSGLINGNFVIVKDLFKDGVGWRILEGVNESPTMGSMLRRSEYENSTELWNKAAHTPIVAILIEKAKSGTTISGMPVTHMMSVTSPHKKGSNFDIGIRELLETHFPDVYLINA
ncbi:MAG TPA: hypothetical protein VND15_00820 [Candidatus Acidoferrales bacterium]|nr:hypothetical protein [Candidatus Acidoferrales bacterium]